MTREETHNCNCQSDSGLIGVLRWRMWKRSWEGHRSLTLSESSQKWPEPWSLTFTEIGQKDQGQAAPGITVTGRQCLHGHLPRTSLYSRRNRSPEKLKKHVQGYTVSRWQSWDSHTGNLTPEPAATGHSHSIILVTHIKAKDQRVEPLEAQSLTGTLEVMHSLAIVFRRNK